MATRQYVTPIGEYTQVWRPRHQLEWSIWEERTELEPPFTLGFPKFFDNGAVYVVAKNGATALTRAHIVSSDPLRHTDTNLVQAAPVLTNLLRMTNGSTAIAEDAFKDGWVYARGGTGDGLNFQVAGNDAVAANADFNVYLKTELPVALDTTTDMRVYTSGYDRLRQYDTTSTAYEIIRGIPPDAISANAYFWLQVRGPAAATASADITIAQNMVALTGADAGEIAVAAAGNQIIGYLMEDEDVDVSAFDTVLVDLRCA